MAETKFIRGKKQDNYTVLDNTFIKDCTLSWKAKGLMTYLLSLPQDWEIYMTELETHSSDGKDSLKSAIKELEEKGYIVKEQKTDKGKFAGYSYTIYETPKRKNRSGKTATEKPFTENPQLLNTNNILNTNKQINTQSKDCEKKKENPKAKLFDRIDEYTTNQQLRDILKKYLQFKLSSSRGFSLEQWNMQLDRLSEYGKGNVVAMISKVNYSYANGYQSLVYDNELQKPSYKKQALPSCDQFTKEQNDEPLGF